MTDGDEGVSDDERRQEREDISEFIRRFNEGQFPSWPQRFSFDLSIRYAEGRSTSVCVQLEYQDLDDVTWTSLPGTWTEGPPLSDS